MEKAQSQELDELKRFVDEETFLNFKKDSEVRWRNFATTGNCNMQISCSSCPTTPLHSPWPCDYKTQAQKIAILNADL